MNPNATVVSNKAKFAKAIHEEADARSSRADHISALSIFSAVQAVMAVAVARRSPPTVERNSSPNEQVPLQYG
jgi:hypothetical protein